MNPYFNETTVLDYIKQKLGAPFNIVEFTDEFIVNNVITSQNYLKEFSQYFPKEERVALTDKNNLDFYNTGEPVPNVGNAKSFYSNRWVLESDNEILGVRNVIQGSLCGTSALYAEVGQYTNPLQFSTENYLRSMSKSVISFHFYYPNIVEVLGMNKTYTMTAILDTVHDKDLSTIPSSLHQNFNMFCLYTLANLILGVRYKYSEMNTPFGSINLNIEWIQQLAEKKQELINEFKHPANFNARGVGIFVV